MGKYNDNPWLGLESYQENQIIYGRNKEIEELSQCVLNNNETVLYGKSGIGKSSIINAGILPIVRAQGYFPIVVRLDHSNKHSYIKQLSNLIEMGAHVSECSIAKPIEEQLLWEYFHTHRFNKTKEEKSKLVIIFDQFEEIFTLQNNAAIKGRFFNELGDVLNNVMPKGLTEEHSVETRNLQSSTTKLESVSGFADMADLFSTLAINVNTSTSKYIEDNEIHFVFTLREDFLSEFEYYTSKIPSLKQHRYGLRPLNQVQAAEIILKPRPELVDEGVARLIIETVTNRIDFSLGDEPEIDVDAAVLSLFLSQIYDKRVTNDSSISVDLVKTFGKYIIKDFYEEAVESLSSQPIDFLEEKLLTSENRRNSLSRADFKAGGFSEDELKRLIDDKKVLRQFHYEGDLRIEFIHDILCPVVKERKEQRDLILEQELERKRQEEEKQELLQERERERTIRNIEYNLTKRETERNVLTYKGRRLIDNALDFGGLRTINSIALRNPVDKIMAFVRFMKHGYEDYLEDFSDSKFVNQQVFSDPLLKNSEIVLSFYKEDKNASTIDGIYRVDLKYDGALISDIFFKGKRVLSDGSLSFDEPIYILGGYCGIHINYDEKQREVLRIYLDDLNNPIITFDGYSVIQTDYDDKDNPIKIRYYNIKDGKLSVARHIHGNHGYDSVFDKNGNEIERYFIDEDGQPTTIVSGVYGKRMTYDTDWFRLLTISNIDANGGLMADNDGYVTVLKEYDEKGLPTSDFYLDQDGKPWKDPSGIYGIVDKIDFLNNIITVCNLDEHGSCIEDKDGIKQTVLKINEKKQITEFFFLDKNDDIFENENNNSIQLWSYDEQNRLQTVKYYNKNGLFRSGRRFDYNKEGTHIIREYSLSENGISKNEDFEVEGFEYSLNGESDLPILQIFINEHKQFKKCNDGYYAIRTWEDDNEKPIKQLYYDVDGTPMPDNSGIFGLKLEYLDEETTKRIYLDAEENIMENKNGVAFTVERRNSSGSFQINYNIKGEPYENDGWVYINQESIKTNYGYQERLFVLNSSKEQIEILQPHRADAGWGRVPCMLVETNFDDKGRPLSEYFKDLNGNIVGDADGNSYTIWEYDDDINQEILSLYDINDKLRVRIKTIKDSKNRITEQSYINNKNQYEELERGYSGEICEYYDEENKKIVSFIDSKGKICNNKDGFAHRISWYDNFGRLVAQKDVTINGSNHGLIGICEFIDSEKRECAYYIHYEDDQGQIKPNDNGSVFEYFEKDNKGRTIKQLYLNADKQPMLDKEGDYGLSYEYDDEKQLTIITCLDENEQPHNNQLGYGIMHLYDNYDGKVIKRMYYSTEGTPITLSNLLGCYGLSYEYPNENTQIIGYLNENGEITINIHEYAYREEYFNPKTGRIEVFYYDKDRNNTQSFEDENKEYGYAIEAENDSRLIISLGKDGNCTNNACGYAIKEEQYEESKLRFYRFLDVDKRPIADSVGDYGTEILHSNDGSMIRLVSLNEKYERHLNDYGYCFCDIITDITGEQFRIWRDMENNRVLPKLRLGRKIKRWFTNFKKKESQATIFNCRQIGAICDCVLGNIEGNGHGKKQGLHNTYVILQYDDWCFGDEPKKLGELLANSEKQSKHLVLLPVTLDGSLLKDLGGIMEFHFPAGQIGIRLNVWGINEDTLNKIIEKTREWDNR